MMIQKIKGTQDFLDLSLFNYFVDQYKQHIKHYSFSEISTSILEPVELFKRSLGVQTDIVSKEMFLIEPHSADTDERICLRPEATASTTRAFLEYHVQQRPWKVYSYGPMFRYERPQKGRYRQFHQMNIEIIDSASITQDIQLIKMLDRFFHEKLQLNNYALKLNFLGCAQDRVEHKKRLLEYLKTPQAAGICETCKLRVTSNLLRIFDCKNPVCQNIYVHAPKITDCLCQECTKEWQMLQETLSMLSVSFIQAPLLVRGLDYYNKTVFEFVSDNLGAQNAFCGGGRYELATQLGSTQTYPSIGAAIGIERILLLLEEMKDKLTMPQPPALHLILPLSQEQVPLALLLADELQDKSLCVDILTDQDSIKSMLRKANKLGAVSAIIIGEEEQKTRSVVIKNMITGEQKTILQSDVVNHLKG